MAEATPSERKLSPALSTAFKVALFALVIVVGFNLRSILSAITGSEAPIAVVRGASMYPLLREGDVVFSYRKPPESIGVGDVIIYEGSAGKLIIHRVVDVKVINGEYYYVTKGDNNLMVDIVEFSGPNRAGVPYERVKGVVASIGDFVVKVPYIGYLSIWYQGR